MVATTPSPDSGADWGRSVSSGIRSGKLAGLSTLGAIRVVALAGALAAVPASHGGHGGQDACGTSA